MLAQDEIVGLTDKHGGQRGIQHSRRLLRLIKIIGEGEEYDADSVWLAALLHDRGGYSPWARKGIDHAVRSAQVVEPFLKEKGFDGGLIARVLECIEHHHCGDPLESIEEILLGDADALDSLGVVGILRDFSKNPRELRKGFDAAQGEAALSSSAEEIQGNRSPTHPSDGSRAGGV